MTRSADALRRPAPGNDGGFRPLRSPSLFLYSRSPELDHVQEALRISRRRLAGQRVLAHVSTHHLETGEYKPVTAARRYIAEAGLVPPALLNVRRNEHTTIASSGAKRDCSAPSTPENHFLFPSLRTIVDSIGEDTLFEARSRCRRLGGDGRVRIRVRLNQDPFRTLSSSIGCTVLLGWCDHCRMRWFHSGRIGAVR